MRLLLFRVFLTFSVPSLRLTAKIYTTRSDDTNTPRSLPLQPVADKNKRLIPFRKIVEKRKKRTFHANGTSLKNKKNPAPRYSPTLLNVVPSPLRPLTSVFGMGTGVSTSP